MITLTDNALKALKRFIRGSEDPIGGLRVAVTGGGCSGLQYSLALKPAPEDGDVVVEQSGIQLYIDPASAPMLEAVTVDFVDSMTGGGFKFTNPNASNACGCGNSFAV